MSGTASPRQPAPRLVAQRLAVTEGLEDEEAAEPMTPLVQHAAAG